MFCRFHHPSSSSPWPLVTHPCPHHLHSHTHIVPGHFPDNNLIESCYRYHVRPGSAASSSLSFPGGAAPDRVPHDSSGCFDSASAESEVLDSPPSAAEDPDFVLGSVRAPVRSGPFPPNTEVSSTHQEPCGD
ncbi:hypothetical protein Vafri_13447 [Volvox africanus]|nr:hypothetical protein Vafri_13447 [Volvox africanus]